jgi:hypothetical protein
MLRALAVVVATAALVPAAGASQQRGFAFGRAGGNIQPFRVVIATDGNVHATGATHVGRTHLTRIQLGELNRLAATNSFGSLPRSTSCAGTLPDVAATFIRVGPRTVTVHGGCLAAYQRLWTALARAVRLSN